MTDIMRLEDSEGVNFYPQTHIDAVVGYQGGGTGGSGASLPGINSGQWMDMTMSYLHQGSCKYYRDSDNFIHVHLSLSVVPENVRLVAHGLPTAYRPMFLMVGQCYGGVNDPFEFDTITDTMVLQTNGDLEFYSHEAPIVSKGWGGWLRFYTFYRSR